MRLPGLGACLTLSLALNLVGFAPLMNYLLSHPGGGAAPPTRTQLQVRLINPQREPPRQARTKAPPLPSPIPKIKPAAPVVRKPPVRPLAAQRPRLEVVRPVPQAPHRSHRPSTSSPHIPSRPQPDPVAVGPVVSAPALTQPAAPLTPTPQPSAQASPSSSPEPLPEPPVSQGNDLHQGIIPDRPAMPKTHPPKANIWLVPKSGGNSSIQLQVKIYPDGHIDVAVLVSSGQPELDQAVLKDLKDWRWDPALVAGKPVLSEKKIKLQLEGP